MAPIVAGAASPDLAIAGIATAQHSLVTTAQLRYAGIGRSAHAHRARTGRLHFRHRGVWQVGHRADTPLTPMAAALLSCGPTAALSHWSAAILWELVAISLGEIHIAFPGRSMRSRPGIVVHRMAALESRDLRTRRGLPLTSPSVTLLDLADVATPQVVERALNEARIRRLTSQGELAGLLARSPGRRGRRILASLVEEGSDFSRKEAERILWRLIIDAGLPRPRRNFHCNGYELDFFWPELRLNVEVDGYRWHSTRDRLNRDRERDARLMTAGIQVLRLTWDQLKRPQETIARLAAAIALASERTRLAAGSPG